MRAWCPFAWHDVLGPAGTTAAEEIFIERGFVHTARSPAPRHGRSTGEDAHDGMRGSTCHLVQMRGMLPGRPQMRANS
jgi:hypothetical protein